MNLNTNNVNFQGRTEVLYGLKKAAQEAQTIGRNAAQSMGPRPIIKNNEICKANGALDAYCDMAVKDESFIQTINSITPRFINELKEILSPIKTEYCRTYPQDTFIKSFKNASENAKIQAEAGVNNFLEKIKM